MGIVVPQPGIKPTSDAVEAQSPTGNSLHLSFKHLSVNSQKQIYFHLKHNSRLGD